MSQYEHEAEVLMPPLCGLEVTGTRVEGATLVVEMKLAINQKSLTLQQVIGRRKKLLQDLSKGLETDVRQANEREGRASKAWRRRRLQTRRRRRLPRPTNASPC